jgi:death-on-curing protein
VTRHLTVEQALRIARVAVGGPVRVRDVGLLQAAVHRPGATVFGQDAYPTLLAKAAALLHSLARNRPLVAIAAGELDDVDEIASVLRGFADG